MDISRWMSEDSVVRFGKVERLASEVEEKGYVRRAYGISEALLDLLDQETLIAAFVSFLKAQLHHAETKAGLLMEMIGDDHEEAGEEVLDQMASIKADFEIEGLEAPLDVRIVVHQFRIGELQYDRFLAVLLPSQVTAYEQDYGLTD